ncbi:hypothetical protein [Faecalispora anaeroviscerum]|uniref:hypothetical protein n=1 Tax=Faecalispora anaeroviscerum TaxID=2991836 RepID=UPI0024B9A4AB|nr:hypothetical protein [Faecalispora anaeroviscerum]
MEAKEIYTASDCVETGSACSIKGKAMVLNRESLPENCRNQLFFCLCGNGAGVNPSGCAVFLVSLNTGEFSLKMRGDVVGVLKPELLPDSAKLQLSQIRPVGALDVKNHEPKYSGYSFLPDGRYASGVWLCSEKEVMDYIEMQKDYQHRVMICDRDDFCVFEMIKGEIVHPSPEAIEAFRAGQKPQDGGMHMNQ